MSQDIRIDRLSLRIPGVDEDAARDLARLVALRLAAGEFPYYQASDTSKTDIPKMDNRISGVSGSGSGEAAPAASGSISIRVAAGSGEPDELAGRIAGEIWRALERGVIP